VVKWYGLKMNSSSFDEVQKNGTALLLFHNVWLRISQSVSYMRSPPLQGVCVCVCVCVCVVAKSLVVFQILCHKYFVCIFLQCSVCIVSLGLHVDRAPKLIYGLVLETPTSSSQEPVHINAPVSIAALGLLCNPKYYIQPRFRNPMPRMKRQRSLTEVVRTFVGLTTRLLKTLKR
jgi:hypothetical protein